MLQVGIGIIVKVQTGQETGPVLKGRNLLTGFGYSLEIFILKAPFLAPDQDAGEFFASVSSVAARKLADFWADAMM